MSCEELPPRILRCQSVSGQTQLLSSSLALLLAFLAEHHPHCALATGLSLYRQFYTKLTTTSQALLKGFLTTLSEEAPSASQELRRVVAEARLDHESQGLVREVVDSWPPEDKGVKEEEIMESAPEEARKPSVARARIKLPGLLSLAAGTAVVASAVGVQKGTKIHQVGLLA